MDRNSGQKSLEIRNIKLEEPDCHYVMMIQCCVIWNLMGYLIDMIRDGH